MKAQRHMKILEIISEYAIDTQEGLLEKLKEAGFETTQATISRDIKELRLIQTLDDNGTYRYTVSQKENVANISSKLSIVLRESVVNVDFANNITVIRTLTGMAHAAASAVDAMDRPEILGTLAGDDTIFILMRTNSEASKLCDDLRQMLGA